MIYIYLIIFNIQHADRVLDDRPLDDIGVFVAHYNL